MATSPSSADSPPTTPNEPDETTAEARFKQKKLLVVLGATALGGALLGIAGMALIAYMKPAAEEHPAPPVIVAPAPDPKQEALVEELNALKTKNEKLEEQLKLSQSIAPVSAPDAVSFPTPVPAPDPIIRHNRSADAREKVTADCTVPDKTSKLSEKLKSCIEDFNTSTK